MMKKNCMLLSETTAEKYFGSSDPIGKTLIFNDNINYEITGIFKDIPDNSHIHFDLLVRFESIYDNDNWDQWNYFTYLLTKPGTNALEFKEKTIQWAGKNRPDKLDDLKDINYQPLSQIHFQFNRKNHEPSIEKYNIYAAIFIAFLILVIACINFANLSTIQSFERAKEIAVRKILGESRHRLKMILITEALTVSVFSLFLSLILVENILPVFNRLFESHLFIDLTDPRFIFLIICLILITGILSGIYPAFVLSSFRPVDLFGKSYRLKGKQSISTILVVAQFSISIIIMICLFTISRQMNFVHSQKPGMNPENVVNIRLQSPSIIKHANELREELIKNPGVISASVNGYMPSQHNEHWGLNFNEKKGDGSNENEGLWIIIADKSFFNTMQLEILEGEELIHNYSASEYPFILNESAAELIEDGIVVGREFEFFGNNKGRIIGKVRDFHFRSLHHKIEPAAIILADRGNQISVKMKSDDIRSTLSLLEKTWNRFSPDLSFDYYFLDEDFDQLYKSEIKANRLLITAGILSMLLCCLGIYGIVAYTARKRSKEIGIRKVNGAHTGQIIAMLSKDYTWWLVISFLIACPVAYFLMHRWLHGFAYKTTLAWWLFAAAGIIAFAVAILTSYWQSRQVANQNPVDALRYE
jgi:putative ABC transport system permease protein